MSSTKVCGRTRLEKLSMFLGVNEFHPCSSFADLYDAIIMPLELRKVNQANYKSVMEVYGFWGKIYGELAIMYENRIPEY